DSRSKNASPNANRGIKTQRPRDAEVAVQSRPSMKRILKHLLWIVPLTLIVLVMALGTYAAIARRADTASHSKLQKTILVTSDNFQNQQEMPVEFSCKGQGRSPQIRWANPPDRTKSYALIAMDWDAPSPSLRLFTVVHWVL